MLYVLYVQIHVGEEILKICGDNVAKEWSDLSNNGMKWKATMATWMSMELYEEVMMWNIMTMKWW